MRDTVFISYVHDDREPVMQLCAGLESAGVSVWLDRNELVPGQRWRWTIRQAIQSGKGFIACFSNAYFSRERSFMNQELAWAIDELAMRPWDRGWFFPVRLDDCTVPDRPIGGNETLRDLQYIDLFPDLSNGVPRLIGALQNT